MKRGATLIELMIVVALIGISTLIVGSSVIALRRQSTEVAQREQALQVLEFEASALTARSAGDPSVRARLMGELVEPMVDSQGRGPATLITVSWKGPAGNRLSRSLAVLAGRGK